MPYSNLGISEPTPFDPAQANVWANTINNNMTLLDNAVAGFLPVTVSSSDIVLTVAAGAVDQSRNAHFSLSGTLTGNRSIFFPAGRTEAFSVGNGTSATASGYTITVAVNNGSSSAAGTTVNVPTGVAYCLASDGTNIVLRNPAAPIGYLVAASNLSDVSSSIVALSNLGGATAGSNTNITSLNGLTTPLSVLQGGTNASNTSSALATFGIGTMALRNVFIQSGGSASGGTSGDIFLVY